MQPNNLYITMKQCPLPEQNRKRIGRCSWKWLGHWAAAGGNPAYSAPCWRCRTCRHMTVTWQWPVQSAPCTIYPRRRVHCISTPSPYATWDKTSTEL